MILWLSTVGRENLREVGGKAAGLGELMRAGLPVPDGFCVTTAAYVHHAEACGLRSAIAPELAGADWAAASAHARRLIEAAPVEPRLGDELRAARARLRAPRVAVRSSATCEDSAAASFAGQQDTLLDVEGEAALLDAVRRCWASLWNERALRYRVHTGSDPGQAALAVVVQAMVPARAAAVVFTADPLTTDGESMLLEAASGAASVVGGEVTPDAYRVERGRLAISWRRPVRPEAPVLRDDQVLELAALALRAEAHFGSPQDVEAAFTDDRLYLLQSRPFTARRGADVEEVPRVTGPLTAEQSFALSRIAERYPRAPKPLDNLAVWIFTVGPTLRGLRRLGFAVSRAVERDFWGTVWREALVLPRPRPSVGLVTLPVRLWRLWRRDWRSWWEEGPVRELIALGSGDRWAELSDGALIVRLQSLCERWLAVMTDRWQGTIAMYLAGGLLERLVRRAVGPSRLRPVMAALLDGLDTRTSDVNRSVWALSRMARDAAARGAVGSLDVAALQEDQGLRSAMARFLEEHGHREGGGFAVSAPTWRRNPRAVWDLVAMQAALADDWPPAKAKGGGEVARAEVEAGLPGPAARWLFRIVLERYRTLQVFEEDSHYDMTRPLDTVQALVAECARRLVDRGLLTRPEEVFFLSYDELPAWMSSPPDPREARRHLERRQATYPVADARWTARLFGAVPTTAELSGAAASAGVARGHARLIETEAEFQRLQPGDVLVCRATNPAWTVLFASAAAVVTEVGGATSHAAIVAREYGIPAVMGVRAATRLIADGQPVVVDGSAGRVQLGSLAETTTAFPA
jgi:pyruvate,water dikinase